MNKRWWRNGKQCKPDQTALSGAVWSGFTPFSHACMYQYLGDNCIQIFYLGRYIVGYTVRNLVLWWRASGAIKRDFRTYIRQYTSSNENFEYGYPHSNALLQFQLESERSKPHKAARHPRKCDVINDVKLCPAVYRRIYCRKFLKLSNQMSRYISKCIRIWGNLLCGWCILLEWELLWSDNANVLYRIQMYKLFGFLSISFHCAYVIIIW